jgi:ankyrin repeat protein
MNGSKDIVNFLIQHKINITAKDKQNKTAIEYANENKQEEVLSILIEMWPKQTKLPLLPNVKHQKSN